METALDEMIREAFSQRSKKESRSVKCPVCKRNTWLYQPCKHCGTLVKRSKGKKH